MITWTIQPQAIWEQIQETGIYTCDSSRIPMPEFTDAYDWHAERMAERIGPPPPGVRYPVWAWYQWDGKRKKPDLRSARWGYGSGGEDYVCLELDVPDEAVVLSDFDNWHFVLNPGLISDTEEEDNLLCTVYENLPDGQKTDFLHRNWERVFDLTPLDNGWTRCGDSIQATFWALQREYIRQVTPFKTARRRK